MSNVLRHLQPIAELLWPSEDYRRAERVDQAITGDGRPRADRLAGNLPVETLVAVDSLSVRSDQTSVSDSEDLSQQLQDLADSIIDGAVTAADTTSLQLTATPTMLGTELSGDVVNGGHSHDSGTYQYLRYRADQTISVTIGNVPANSCEDHLYTLTGVHSGDPVFLGPPPDIVDDLIWGGYVTGPDQLVIRICNVTGSLIAGGIAANWKVRVGL
jgi:hypothetical protein